MDLVAEFYAAVGLTLERERHGAGPEHFSFRSDVCVEIYPPREPADATYVFRVDVDDVDGVVATLKGKFNYGELVVREPEALKTGKKAIVKDPDGRVVELFQAFRP